MSRYLPHIALGSLLLAGGGLTWRYHRMAQKLEVLPKLRLASIDYQHLILAVDTRLKNPTAGRLLIRYPYVKISQGGNLLGSSQVVDQKLEIPAFGELILPEIRIQIPLLQLGKWALELIAYLKGESPQVSLKIEVLTALDFVLGSIPLQSSQVITFKRPSDGSENK